MAKKDSAAKQKKSKGKKVLFLILFLLIVSLGLIIWYYWGWINQELLSGSSEEEEAAKSLQVKIENEQIQQLEIEQAIQKKNIALAKAATKYYVLAGSCMYSMCSQHLTSKIKQMKLPVFMKKRYHKTKYYKLVTIDDYDQKRALEKIKLINRYNKRLNKPHLIPSKKGYRISFGLFPAQEHAREMGSYLSQLYPQVTVNFILKETINQYKETLIYSGPFISKKRAKATQDKFMTISEITANLITTTP